MIVCCCCCCCDDDYSLILIQRVNYLFNSSYEKSILNEISWMFRTIPGNWIHAYCTVINPEQKWIPMKAKRPQLPLLAEAIIQCIQRGRNVRKRLAEEETIVLKGYGLQQRPLGVALRHNLGLVGENNYAVIAELVHLKQQQNHYKASGWSLPRPDKGTPGRLNQLLDSLPRKANGNVVWKAMGTKATVKYVDKLYEQSSLHKQTIQHIVPKIQQFDDIQEAFKVKADLEVVKELATEVKNIKANIDKYISEALSTLTLGTRDRLRNVATKLS